MYFSQWKKQAVLPEGPRSKVKQGDIVLSFKVSFFIQFIQSVFFIEIVYV